MNSNPNSLIELDTERSLTENEIEKEESFSELESLSQDTDGLQSHVETTNCHLKCFLDTNTTRNEYSEQNLTPVIWQKFQFLISVLKVSS